MLMDATEYQAARWTLVACIENAWWTLGPWPFQSTKEHVRPIVHARQQPRITAVTQQTTRALQSVPLIRSDNRLRLTVPIGAVADMDVLPAVALPTTLVMRIHCDSPQPHSPELLNR